MAPHIGLPRLQCADPPSRAEPGSRLSPIALDHPAPANLPVPVNLAPRGHGFRGDGIHWYDLPFLPWFSTTAITAEFSQGGELMAQAKAVKVQSSWLRPIAGSTVEGGQRSGRGRDPDGAGAA